MWAKVTVPAGTHRLSPYFFNKDGHDGSNRMRDYLVELKKGEAKSVEEAEILPTQSSARVRDFWGGVYKHFVVQGPGTFWLKVGRNNSFNAILNGVFIDKLSGEPTRWEKRRDVWFGNVRYEIGAQTPMQLTSTRPTEVTEAVSWEALWMTLDSKKDSYVPLQWEARVLSLRAIGTFGWGNHKPNASQILRGGNPRSQTLLKRWRWEMSLWTDGDRTDWRDAMQLGWNSVTTRNPALLKAHY